MQLVAEVIILFQENGIKLVTEKCDNKSGAMRYHKWKHMSQVVNK